MSCEAESQNATPPGPAIAPGAEGVDPRAVAAEIGAGRYSWHGGAGVVDPRIRELVPEFDGPFFQAGLAGYSDAAMRIIARRHGCPMCVTEALLDRTLLAGGRGFTKADLGDLKDNVPGGDEDFPLSGQIMGSEPAEMAAAALKMVEQGARREREYRLMAYDGKLAPGAGERSEAATKEAKQRSSDAAKQGAEKAPRSAHVRLPLPCCIAASLPRSFSTIDVNLACPVKKISTKARGGHWLSEPEGAIEILEAVREALPGHIPCTVKLRRSFDDTPEMVENFYKIYDAAYSIGYAWTTVHARTVQQKYVGPSRWTFLRSLRQRNPDRIFFGSGDVWSVHDIFRMIGYAGVNAVSVARGCIGNPWIFRQAREMMAGRAPAPPTLAEQRQVLDEHFSLMLAVNHKLRHSEETSSRNIRKFGIRFSEHHPRREEVRQRIIAVENNAQWKSLLDDFYGLAALSPPDRR
jgi:tRNA-dihydrouridine synthase B